MCDHLKEKQHGKTSECSVDFEGEDQECQRQGIQNEFYVRQIMFQCCNEIFETKCCHKQLQIL